MVDAVRRLALALMALTVAGCAGADQQDQASDCRGGHAEPISTDHVVTALREHGFTAEPDPTGCGGAADIVMGVNNTESADDEGHVLCAVRRRPIYGAGFSRLPGTGKTTVFWVQDNVECALYARRDAEDETARLRAAFHAMARKASP